MSNTATKWAWSIADGSSALSSSAILVLVALAHFHNQETGRCNPSMPRIAQRTGLSVRSVQYAIKALRTAGLLKVYYRRVQGSGGKINCPNTYVFLTGGGAKYAPGVAHVLHPKGEYKSARARPAAFYDLANLIELEED